MSVKVTNWILKTWLSSVSSGPLQICKKYSPLLPLKIYPVFFIKMFPKFSGGNFFFGFNSLCGLIPSQSESKSTPLTSKLKFDVLLTEVLENKDRLIS